MYGVEFEPINFVCPRCGNGNYTRYMRGKNIGEYNIKCLNCNAYFKSSEFYGNREVKKPTNYDVIIRKTPEEIAEWIDSQVGSSDWCDKDRLVGGACKSISCIECILEWLRQEAE